MSNWYRLAAGEWATKRPTNLLEHLQSVFALSLPEAGGQWPPDDGQVYFLKSRTSKYRMRGQLKGQAQPGSYDFAGFFFVSDGKLYRFDTRVTAGAQEMLAVGVKGDLQKVFVRDPQPHAESTYLAEIGAPDPTEALRQIVSAINLDKDDDEGGEQGYVGGDDDQGYLAGGREPQPVMAR